MSREISPRAVTVAAASGVGLGVLSALASLGTATYFARRVVTPESEKKDDTWVLDVGEDTVTLVATPSTLSPGRYGLWLDGGAGHLRLGEVVGTDLTARRASGRTVTRRLLGVDAGVPAPGSARWNTYYFCGDPSALDLAFDDVLVPAEIGELPAWRVPPGCGDGSRWAILVHGRSANRVETLRALPVLHGLGMTSLVPMYRNDEGAPPSVDGRYNLGLSEWRDVEAALRYALAQGAREVTLVGWSMGGSLVLQLLDRSDLSGWVDSVVLDCPVIDWTSVLRHQADVNRLPRPADQLARLLMGRRSTRFLIGVAEPLDLAVTNWVDRAEELNHPILLIHSATDETVPYQPSVRLADRRPDLVTLDLWDGPLHCQEWNTDSERWERTVREFLSRGDAPGA